MEVRTRAGVKAKETERPYDITTEETEAYIQDKFDRLVKIMRQNGSNVENIKIMLTTIKCGKKMRPFMLILPLSVLANKKDSNRSSELDIFNPEEAEKCVRLKKEFFELINPYLFDKNDERSFFSNNCRQALGLSLKMSQFLKQNRIPKIQKFNNGKNKYVAFVIDPLRVFYDMLTDVNNKDEKFKVEVSKTELIKSGNWLYEACRMTGKKKKHDSSFEDKIALELNKRING